MLLMLLICERSHKLLGIDIHVDFKLNFELHINNICRKAAHQLHVLKHLGHICRRLIS